MKEWNTEISSEYSGKGGSMGVATRRAEMESSNLLFLSVVEEEREEEEDEDDDDVVDDECGDE